MAKDITTGVLVRSDEVAWATLKQAKAGIECVAEGGDEASLSEIKTAVVLALNSTDVLLRVMEFPLVDDDEIAEMVELQVDKFSPFPIDQMVVSHEVISRDESSISVLVAAAKEKAVDVAAVVLKQHGYKIERVDVALLGLWKNIVDAGALVSDGRETLVIVSSDSIDVVTHENAVPMAISCLGGLPDLSDASVANDISQEISHLLVGLEIEHGRAPHQQITLWTNGGNSIFVAALKSVCDMEVFEKSLGILPTVEHGVALRSLKEGKGQVAGGGLLDLTPEAWRLASASKRSKRSMIIAALAVLSVWVLVVAGGLGWLKFEGIRLNKLKKVDTEWLDPANKVRQLRLQVSMIERYTDHTYSALECLREISGMQPEGVDLSSFTYRKGEGVGIDGEADSGSLVNQFNEALNKSALFVNVKPGTRTRTKQGRHRFSFDITFPKEEL